MRDKMLLDPVIRLTYSTVLWEGEDEEPAEDHGWADTRGGRYPDVPEGEPMSLDQWDIEDGETVVTKAVSFLQDHGITDPSCSPEFSSHIWYSGEATQGYRTGEYETLSAHLDGFNYAEQWFIWARLTGQL